MPAHRIRVRSAIEIFQRSGLAFTLVALLACAGEPADNADREATAFPFGLKPLEPEFVLGGPAPDFSLSVMAQSETDELAGDTIRLSDFRGQVLVLNFWDTGCKPCVAEHETLNAVATEYQKRGVRFLGVVAYDTEASLKRCAREHGPTVYPNLGDRSREVTKSYQAVGVPLHVVIDAEGRVAWWHPGGPIKSQILVEVIEDVLAGRRPDAPTSATYPTD